MNSSLTSKPRRETGESKLNQSTKDGHKKTNCASKNNIRRTKYEQCHEEASGMTWNSQNF